MFIHASFVMSHASKRATKPVTGTSQVLMAKTEV